MKTKMLAVPVPVRAVMPRGGWTSCLPPVRARPPVKPAAPDALPVNTSVCVAGTVVDVNYGGYDAEYFDEQFGEGDDARDANALDNLSDAELAKLEPVVAMLKAHDWYYSYSDDIHVFRRGSERETAMKTALAELPYDQAAALWRLYAPAAFGGYRR